MGLAMCFLAACAEPLPETRVLSGFVIDHATSLPLPGASVFGAWGAVTTGPTGDFRVAVAASARELRIRKDGYEDVRRVGLGEDPLVIGLFPSAPTEATEHAVLDRRVRQPDDALRPAAKAILDEVERHDGDRPTAKPAPRTPASIRVWRRGIDGSTDSCAGRVDVIPFEDYVKGVLPHEWILSWEPKSLEMGALAVRTYAWFWVEQGGRYDCADLDDTTRSQVYKDERFAKSDAAVDATQGIGIVKNGALVVAEYSAENGDPTAFGVDEPHCTGREVYGHGRGTCQWGTQRWAKNEGKDYHWMAAHYYPGASAQRIGWGATYAAQSAPTEMIAGETAEVWFSYTNAGNEPWSLGNVRLGATEPRDRESAFAVADDWLDPSHPTSVDSDVAPGEVGRFTFRVRAPEVTAATDFVESFALEGPDGYFGPEDNRVNLRIKVVPRQVPITPPDDDDDDVAALDEVSGGCAVAPAKPPGRHDFARLGLFLLLGAAVVRRGRRWTTFR